MENNDQILAERAKVLSFPLKGASDRAGNQSILVTRFLLTPEVYGIEAIWIREVLPLKSLTTIPGTPSFVMGVVNVRGQIISVVNLKRLFNLEEKGISELNKIIIIRNDRLEFGILADSVIGMEVIELSDIQSSPLTLNGTGADYVTGVTRDGLIVLDGQKILNSSIIIVNDKIK